MGINWGALEDYVVLVPLGTCSVTLVKNHLIIYCVNSFIICFFFVKDKFSWFLSNPTHHEFYMKSIWILTHFLSLLKWFIFKANLAPQGLCTFDATFNNISVIMVVSLIDKEKLDHSYKTNNLAQVLDNIITCLLITSHHEQESNS